MTSFENNEILNGEVRDRLAPREDDAAKKLALNAPAVLKEELNNQTLAWLPPVQPQNLPTGHVATTVTPVEFTDTAEAKGILEQWLEATERMSDRKDSFRSQVSGMIDALRLVEQQKFSFDTHVAEIEVTEGDHSYLVFFHYQIPLVKSTDRRRRDNASAKLAGIVKDPRVTKSAPPAAMLAIHMYVAGQATNRSVQLQADMPRLIKYYEGFGYTVDEGQQGAQKPWMTATQTAMSLSKAATSL